MTKMAMKNSHRIYIALVSSATIAVIGMFVFLSTQFSSDEVRAGVLGITKQIFPGAQGKLGEVKISLGGSTRLTFLDVELLLPNGNKLISIERMVVKVPIAALFSDKAKIELTVDKPHLYYRDAGEEWGAALGGDNSLPIPLLASISGIDFKMFDTQVHIENESGVLKTYPIRKVLLKNIGIKGASAYEIDSLVRMTLPNGKELKLMALAIGEFSLPDLIIQRRFKIASMITTTDGVYDQSKTLPDIKADVQTSIGQEGVQIDFNSEFGNASHIKAKSFLKDSQLIVSSLDIDLLLSDTLKFIEFEKNKLTVGKTHLKVSGDLLLGPGPSFVSNLGIETKGDIVWHSAQGDMSFSLLGKIQDGHLDFVSKGRFLGGDFSLTMESPFPKGRSSFNLEEIGPYKGNMVLTGQRFNSDLFVFNKRPGFLGYLLPSGEVSVDIKNIESHGRPVEGIVTVKTHKDTVSFATKDLKGGPGSIAATVDMTTKSTPEPSDLSIKLDGINIDTKALNVFFPPALKVPSGIGRFQFEGRRTDGVWNKTKWKMSLVNGEVGFPIEVESSLNVKEQFSEFDFDATANKDVWSVSKLSFVGKNFDLKAKGKIGYGQKGLVGVLQESVEGRPTTIKKESVSIIKETEVYKIENIGAKRE